MSAENQIPWHYPTPVAEAFRLADSDGPAAETHAALLSLAEVTLTYLATVAWSEYRAGPGPSPRVEEVVTKAVRGASMGNWLELFRTVIAERRSPLLGIDLFHPTAPGDLPRMSDFVATWRDVSKALLFVPTAQLQQYLHNQPRQSRPKLTIADFWNAVVECRNRHAHPSASHGDPPYPADAALYSLLNPVLKAGLAEVLVLEPFRTVLQQYVWAVPVSSVTLSQGKFSVDVSLKFPMSYKSVRIEHALERSVLLHLADQRPHVAFAFGMGWPKHWGATQDQPLPAIPVVEGAGVSAMSRFRELLDDAGEHGVFSPEELRILERQRRRLGISEETAAEMIRAATSPPAAPQRLDAPPAMMDENPVEGRAMASRASGGTMATEGRGGHGFGAMALANASPKVGATHGRNEYGHTDDLEPGQLLRIHERHGGGDLEVRPGGRFAREGKEFAHAHALFTELYGTPEHKMTVRRYFGLGGERTRAGGAGAWDTQAPETGTDPSRPAGRMDRASLLAIVRQKRGEADERVFARLLDALATRPDLQVAWTASGFVIRCADPKRSNKSLSLTTLHCAMGFQIFRPHLRGQVERWGDPQLASRLSERLIALGLGFVTPDLILPLAEIEAGKKWLILQMECLADREMELVEALQQFVEEVRASARGGQVPDEDPGDAPEDAGLDDAEPEALSPSGTPRPPKMTRQTLLTAVGRGVDGPAATAALADLLRLMEREPALIVHWSTSGCVLKTPDPITRGRELSLGGVHKTGTFAVYLPYVSDQITRWWGAADVAVEVRADLEKSVLDFGFRQNEFRDGRGIRLASLAGREQVLVDLYTQFVARVHERARTLAPAR